MSAEENGAAKEKPYRDEILEDVRAAQGGDDEAFTRVIRSHAGRVTRMVARFAKSTADVEELAQEVFIEVHRSLSRYREDAPFEHWVSRIATHRCLDYLRQRYRRRWWTSLDALREAGFDPALNLVTTDPRVEQLKHALAQLRPEAQTVLTLLELEGYSVREVSALTTWSEANVKVRAHRARVELRRRMELESKP